ncbi:acetate/propionate family kinase [Mycoplasmopsis lipofaciens]|uniref:acetate/propionate family kinase n=1 Tax=Mycoplasmopsis lipofaciens TaxID=114884 RepID=UPI000489BFA8|nr:acetate/propionate family kinase [Mycoplasmopsis lipofaciens]
MKSKILVINSGSSSIKLSLFDKETLKVIANGLAEKIKLPLGNIKIKHDDKVNEISLEMKDHTVAVENIINLMKKMKLIENPKEIEIIGFRVVHGGPYFNSTTKLDDENIELINKASIYAPLHNPGAVQAMLGFKKVMPHAKMCAEFDTSFHTTIEDINSIYPIPFEWTEKFNIKKYGAHGISHEFCTLKLENILNKKNVNFINLHIGNGASLCAVKNSKSIDTSMGLTPLAGIMMGTRSGDIDPSIPNFVAENLNLDIKTITDDLNNKSGLLGVSGVSSDMRDLLKAIDDNNERAKFAFDLYTQKIIDYCAMYANKIGKLDALVFTAGVGENTPNLRENIAKKINFAKIEIDDTKNYGKIGEYELISTPNSEVKVFVLRTNEELLIAKHALELFK